MPPFHPSRPRHIGQTLFNLLFASFGYVAIRMLIAPVRIKLLTSLLTKEDYGLLTLIMLTVSFITILASLGSFEFMRRTLPGSSHDDQLRILRTVVAWFGVLAAAIALIGVFYLLVWPPAKLHLTSDQSVACGLILVLTVHLTQLVCFLMGRSDYAQSRLLMLLYSDAWFLPLLGLMWFTDITVSVMLWLWAIWLIVSLGVSQIWVRTRDIFRRRPSRGQIGQILRFGIPLMPMIMGEWIFQMQDRYVLLAVTNLEAVANYTLCFNIAWVGAATGTSLLDVLITEFYKARNLVPSSDPAVLFANASLKKSFTLMLRYAMVLSLPIGLALWIARVPIILLLSAPKFADVAPLMRWVAPLPVLYLMTVIGGRALVSLDRSVVVGLSTLCAAGINLILSLLLTPVLAERGIALSGCIAYGMLAMYLGFRGCLHRWIDWKELRLGRLFIYAFVCGWGIHLAVFWLGPHPLVALLVAGSLILGAMVGFGLVRKEDVRHLMDSMHRQAESENPADS